jgi:tRNA(Arg) A34 adenosine deaminase TadA
MNNDHTYFINRAIALAQQGIQLEKGGPFGAVVVKDNNIIGEGFNQVTSCNDPTAHAEITAIRNACKSLENFSLSGCVLYTSCEPCPMCLGAIFWARLDAIYYAGDRRDASDAGFDDALFYEQINLTSQNRVIPQVQLERKKALEVFSEWKNMNKKTTY